MTVTMTVAELREAGERELGVSGWHRIDQEQIDRFAEATGDHQWIHVDAERARAGPFGTTIAHGYCTLSLLPYLLAQVLTVSDAGTRINYGIDRVRFTAPVPSGAEVRAKARLLGSEARGEGVVYKVGVEVEVKGAAKPALIGEVLYLVRS
jgi:acyl dehydratase